MIGETLSHYQVLEKLGEGGMGVVYKARDTQLDRFVAIKVLQPGRGAASFRRFVQEARSASALNHPNIVTIHEISSHESTDFLVMEFVSGQTLHQLIPRKGLPLKDALRYAVQIADALAAAHAAGIIHRDLKPGNVMITEKGLVKVLDFGLAKFAEASAVEPSGDTRTMLAAPATGEGTILGTVDYMSPEQAEGKLLDRRSDIFSFGVMLYEMLAGERPFSGGTTLSTLSAILTREPRPVSELSSAIPRDLEKIIARCLKKDPAWRYQYLDDVKVALAELQQESESGQLPRHAPSLPTRRSFTSIALSAGVGLVAGVGGAAWFFTRPQPAAARRAFTQLTRDTGLTADPAISADGKLIACASDRAGDDHSNIWVQQVSGGGAIRLTSGNADDSQPSFSPDGSRIVFRSTRDGGGLYVVPTLGGEAVRIAPAGANPRFSPDGNWVVYTFLGALSVVAVPHGTPFLLSPDFSGSSAFNTGANILSPAWSPDGRLLLFGAFSLEYVGVVSTFDLLACPIDFPAGGVPKLGKPVPLGVGHLFRDGNLRFTRNFIWMNDEVYLAALEGDNSNIWRLPVDSKTLRVGSLEPLTSGSAQVEAPSVSHDGRVVFASTDTSWDLWSLPVDTNRAARLGEPARLRTGRTMDAYPYLAPENNKLVFGSFRGTQWDVWLRDLATGREIALADSNVDEINPILSPDGSKVAYQTSDGPRVTFHVVPAAGGAPQKIFTGEGRIHLSQWAPGGESLLIERYSKTKVVDLLTIRTGKTVEIMRHPEYDLFQPMFSPDEKWILVNPSYLGQELVYIAPFRDGAAAPVSEWFQATDGKFDVKPRWSPDGNTLYFVSIRDGAQSLRAQRLDPATKRPKGESIELLAFSGTRRSPFNMQIQWYEIAVNRDRIVFSQGDRTGNIWMLAEAAKPVNA